MGWVFSYERGTPVGPVVPSFRALSGRLKLTVRRHKSNKDSLSAQGYLADKKPPHPGTLVGLSLGPYGGPTVALGRGAVSYERGTPVVRNPTERHRACHPHSL